MRARRGAEDDRQPDRNELFYRHENLVPTWRAARSALGDAYQELVLGTGSPAPEIFERQIDAALALLGLTSRRPRQREMTRRAPA